MSSDPLLIAQLDFTPVPPRQRHTPGRQAKVPARLYINQIVEHREAAEFLSHMQTLHGEGTRAVVRALLHYRDHVIGPLEELRKQGKEKEAPGALLATQLPFRSFPSPPDGRNTARNVGVRLYIDRYLEHREAAEFLTKMQTQPGAINDAIVRALLCYRDQVIQPLEERRKRATRPARSATRSGGRS